MSLCFSALPPPPCLPPTPHPIQEALGWLRGGGQRRQTGRTPTSGALWRKEQGGQSMAAAARRPSSATASHFLGFSGPSFRSALP